MAMGFAQRILKSGRRLAIFTTASVAVGATVYTIGRPIEAADLIAHPVKMDWPHKFLFNSFDHASIRRGWEVYKQVCAACHSLNYLHYRQMVDVFLTESEAKAEAAEALVQDGPDEKGKMFMRPGILADKISKPYANVEEARAANNGANPPDLSLICIAREGGEDYIFNLLLGYSDPPAGMKLDDGQHFNAYFSQGAISMAQALHDEVIEYSDGTPASASQMAKDVTTFLAWCAMPEHDERKLMAIKVISLLTPIILASWYWKRHTWIQMKTRKIAYKPNNRE